jgi:hypothetical protein
MWPVGALLSAAWVSSACWPRRVPDLRRLTGDSDFRQVQSVVAAWVDRHFEMIESSAPWLDRIGCWISDHCQTSLESHPFSLPRDPPTVGCSRAKTAVYGADGDLPGRLADLSGTLSGVGWVFTENSVLRDLGLYESLMWPFEWSAVEGLGLPEGLHAIPPSGEALITSWLTMGVSWTSRGQSPGLRTTRAAARSGDPGVGTAVYQPVEIGGADVDRLSSQALTRHQHAIAVGIEIVYYKNFNVNAEPGRLRKRPLPVPPWAQGR